MLNNASIELLFPKPIYRVTDLLTNKLDDFESSIKGLVGNNGSERRDGLNVNTTHQTAGSLFLEDEFKLLADACMLHARDFMKQMCYDQYVIDNCKFHKMWANISNERDFLFPHIHGNCLIAGVFYIKAPQQAKIHFYDDLKSVRLESKEYNYMTYEEYGYDCVPGSMLLFKNDMLHGNKVQPPGEKIAISFNIGL